MSDGGRHEPLETRVERALGAYAERVEARPDAWDRLDGALARPSRHGRAVVLAAAAVVAVALGAGAVIAASDGDGRDVPIGGGTTAPTVAPTSPTTPSTTTSTTTTTVPPTTTTTIVFPPDTLGTFTGWSPLDLTELQEVIDERMPGGAESPGAAADAIAAGLLQYTEGSKAFAGGAVLSEGDGEALIEVRVRGYASDTTVGSDYRLTLAVRTGWVVTGGEVRHLCARAVDAENLCV